MGRLAKKSKGEHYCPHRSMQHLMGQDFNNSIMVVLVILFRVAVARFLHVICLY